MKIEVRSKIFDINFVNNYCREQYTKLVDLVDAIADIPDEVSNLNDDEKKFKKIKDLNRKQKELTKEIVDRRKEILIELLETNDYEYDAVFWMRRTDVNDINRFIIQAMEMDLIGRRATKKK